MLRREALVVICEVKTRSSNKFGAPEESVTASKARRIRRIAAEWLASARASGTLAVDLPTPHGGRHGVDVRFDVASVTKKSRELLVEVIEGAFE